MVKVIVPGAYCLAHDGHIAVIKEAAKDHGQVIVICSENEAKADDRWFTPQECKEAMKVYGLGKNVEIVTLAEFMETYFPGQDILMVRGIRNEKDLAHEAVVMEQNYRQFGVNKYEYIIADEKFRGFSSTKARKLAMEGNIEELKKMVHPKIAAMLIEKAEEIKRKG
jgi:phosphopantetheine adenylyltransferase